MGTLKLLAKPKKCKWNDCGFAHLGQQLSLHPHLHCIVPGGGINRDGQWKNTRTDKFLFPVKLCQSFRANIAPNSKRNHLSNTNKSGRIYGKPGLFC
jgi:hypothetical protein